MKAEYLFTLRKNLFDRDSLPGRPAFSFITSVVDEQLAMNAIKCQVPELVGKHARTFIVAQFVSQQFVCQRLPFVSGTNQNKPDLKSTIRRPAYHAEPANGRHGASYPVPKVDCVSIKRFSALLAPVQTPPPCESAIGVMSALLPKDTNASRSRAESGAKI
jgi:hypothetical protein